MKPEDKDKLNECLKILDSTDLGLSLVWLELVIVPNISIDIDVLDPVHAPGTEIPEAGGLTSRVWCMN